MKNREKKKEKYTVIYLNIKELSTLNIPSGNETSLEKQDIEENLKFSLVI